MLLYNVKRKDKKLWKRKSDKVGLKSLDTMSDRNIMILYKYFKILE